MNLSRRSLLAAMGAGFTTASAGCAGLGGGDSADGTPTPNDPSATQGEPSPTETRTRESTSTPTPTEIPPEFPENDWPIRPEAEPEPVAPLVCEMDESKRVPGWVEGDLAWGNLYDDGDLRYVLRVSASSFELDDVVEIVFRNVSGEDQLTTPFHQFNIEVLTTDGWMDVRVFTGGMLLPRSDVLANFDRGETFVWLFPLSPEGIVNASVPGHQEELAVCPALQPGRYRFAFPETELGDVAVAFDVKAAAEN